MKNLYVKIRKRKGKVFTRLAGICFLGFAFLIVLGPATTFAKISISGITVAPLAGGNIYIEIMGSGFGTVPHFVGDDSDIMVADLNHNGGSWRAGNLGNWDPNGKNIVTINVTEWKDSEIDIYGFNNLYSWFTNWYFSSGDSLRVYLKNPQTGDSTSCDYVLPSFLRIEIAPGPGEMALLFNSSEVQGLLNSVCSRLQSDGLFDPKKDAVCMTVDSSQKSSNVTLAIAALDFLTGLPGLASDVAGNFDEAGVWGVAAGLPGDIFPPTAIDVAVPIVMDILQGVAWANNKETQMYINTSTIDGAPTKYVASSVERMQIYVELSALPASGTTISLPDIFDNVSCVVLFNGTPVSSFHSSYNTLLPSIEVTDFWGNTIQDVSVSAIQNDQDEPLGSFKLLQNFPNPFNPATIVRFNLRENSTVNLSIYDIRGQRVQEFDLGRMSAGTHRQNVNLSRFASGVYFYRIEAVGNDGERFTAMKKMMLIK